MTDESWVQMLLVGGIIRGKLVWLFSPFFPFFPLILHVIRPLVPGAWAKKNSKKKTKTGHIAHELTGVKRRQMASK